MTRGIDRRKNQKRPRKGVITEGGKTNCRIFTRRNSIVNGNDTRRGGAINCHHNVRRIATRCVANSVAQGIVAAAKISWRRVNDLIIHDICRSPSRRANYTEGSR